MTSSGTAPTADRFPAKPVRLVVPFGQEGASDRVARVVAGGLMRRWKKPVLVENLPGAGGAIGVDAARAAPADGHTLLFGTVTNASIAPRLRGGGGGAVGAGAGDFTTTFAPVALLGFAPNVLVVPAASAARDVAGLVASARQRPSAIRYASAGAGQTIHLCGALFATLTGTTLSHVPFAQGSATAYDDLLHGRVDLMFDSVIGALDAIRNGGLRALAVVADERAACLPDVPTMNEAGVRGMAAPIWFGLHVHAAVPSERIARLVADVSTVLGDAAVTDALATLGLAAATDHAPAALRDTIERSDDAWRRNLIATGLVAR